MPLCGTQANGAAMVVTGTSGSTGTGQAILPDPVYALARAVLEGGPFAMRKAEELAEVVLAEDQGESREDEEAGADEG